LLALDDIFNRLNALFGANMQKLHYLHPANEQKRPNLVFVGRGLGFDHVFQGRLLAVGVKHRQHVAIAKLTLVDPIELVSDRSPNQA